MRCENRARPTRFRPDLHKTWPGQRFRDFEPGNRHHADPISTRFANYARPVLCAWIWSTAQPISAAGRRCRPDFDPIGPMPLIEWGWPIVTCDFFLFCKNRRNARGGDLNCHNSDHHKRCTPNFTLCLQGCGQTICIFSVTDVDFFLEHPGDDAQNETSYCAAGISPGALLRCPHAGCTQAPDEVRCPRS